MNTTKQVLVIRKDLKMRRGKEIAQCCHGSMAFLTKDCEFDRIDATWPSNISTTLYESEEAIIHWIKNSFKKVTVYVNSEEELLEIHQKAQDKGLISHLITDNGVTEFKGVPTNTVIAVGPAWEDEFEGVTNHLPLY